MKVDLRPGKYVTAVSGGVDSLVLLDILSKKPDLELVVAHFDHGIRNESAEDRKFVEDLAKNYGLEFYFEEGKLGPDASEAKAREKRYKFLNKILDETDGDAILMAHHQDDVLETAIINLIRGTGRKGLSSLASTERIKRPLLGFSKKQILNYARKNKLRWREDPSNQNEDYLRNWVRKNVVPKLSTLQKNNLLHLIKNQQTTNEDINASIATLLRLVVSENDESIIKRSVFIGLPHDIAKEVVAEILRRENLSIDKKTIERLVVSLKTARTTSQVEINKKHHFLVKKDSISLEVL